MSTTNIPRNGRTSAPRRFRVIDGGQSPPFPDVTWANGNRIIIANRLIRHLNGARARIGPLYEHWKTALARFEPSTDADAAMAVIPRLLSLAEEILSLDAPDAELRQALETVRVIYDYRKQDPENWTALTVHLGVVGRLANAVCELKSQLEKD